MRRRWPWAVVALLLGLVLRPYLNWVSWYVHACHAVDGPRALRVGPGRMVEVWGWIGTEEPVNQPVMLGFAVTDRHVTREMILVSRFS